MRILLFVGLIIFYGSVSHAQEAFSIGRGAPPTPQTILTRKTELVGIYKNRFDKTFEEFKQAAKAAAPGDDSTRKSIEGITLNAERAEQVLGAWNDTMLLDVMNKLQISPNGKVIAEKFSQLITDVRRLQKAKLDQQIALKTIELQDNDGGLKALSVGGGLQLNTGGTKSNIMPSIDAKGTIDDLFGNLKVFDTNMLMININIKPDVDSGSKDNVAQAIRVNSGSFSTKITSYWASMKKGYELNSENGPIGFDVSLIANLAYQRSPSVVSTQTVGADGSTGTTNVTNLSDFGIAAGEVRAGFWLQYLYAGVKYSRNYTFGDKNVLSRDLNNSGVYKAIVISKINSLSGSKEEKKSKEGDGSKELQENPFYVEFNYTGGKNSLNNGTFSLAIAKSFDWNW